MKEWGINLSKSLHQISPYAPAVDSGWLVDGAGRDDDPDPPVAVAGHGSAAGVHQEAGEEAGPRGRARALNRPDQVGSRHLAVKERILARAGSRQHTTVSSQI